MRDADLARSVQSMLSVVSKLISFQRTVQKHDTEKKIRGGGPTQKRANEGLAGERSVLAVTRSRNSDAVTPHMRRTYKT